MRSGRRQEGAFFLLFVDLFVQRLLRLRDAGLQLHPDGDAVGAYLLQAFAVVLHLGELLLYLRYLLLQARQGGLFHLPLTLTVEERALLQLERMALLLDAELYLTLLLLQGVAALQRLRHLRVTLARLVQGHIGRSNARGLLQEGRTGLDFLLQLLQMLPRAALLQLQTILRGG